MGTDAYQRAAAREAKFWGPFTYSLAFTASQTTDRVVIFGLYANAYNNQHGYLVEVEAAELLNLLNEYNVKMSNLTAQEQIATTEIVAKRYLAAIDRNIHDEKMITKTQEVLAENAEWDAKIDALEADRAAIETLATKVTAETDKTAARIAELQAYIETESYSLDAVDIESTEKEIQSARVDVQILDAANAVLKIQMDIVNAGLELIDTDLKIARTKVDLEGVKRDIARTSIVEKELDVAIANTAAAEAGKDVYASRVAIAEKHLEAAGKDVDLYESLVSHEEEIGPKRVGELEAEQARRITGISDHENNAVFTQTVKKDAADFDLQTAENKGEAQETVDANKVSVMANQVVDNQTRNMAATTAAYTLSQADIATTLSHYIKKAT